MIKKLLLLLMVSLFLSSCALIESISDVSETHEPTDMSEVDESILLNQRTIYDSYKDYANEYFTEDHPFYQLNYLNGLHTTGLRSRIDSEELLIVFIGFHTCPACQSQVGTFQRYFESENMSDYVEYIYYLNVIVDEKGYAEFIVDYPEVHGGVPRMLAFKDGQIIAVYDITQHDGISDINHLARDFFRMIKNYIQ